MDREIKQRWVWVRLGQEIKQSGVICRKCGISRPTLRKWIQRYQKEGLKGLQSKSRRPKNSPARKIFSEQESWIMDLRLNRKLGARRIQNELVRLHNFRISLATIQKVLLKNKVKPLSRRHRKHEKRYEKQIPGECVQVDTIKVKSGLFQYTAIDDCTRFIIIMLYPARNAENSVEFLEMVKDGMPFPVQRIQTDRGTEFTAYLIQEALFDWKIKWRPNRAGAPHLNGKVERVQKTILDEFYETIDLRSSDLEFQLAQWEYFYNYERVHSSLGESPMNKVKRLQGEIPKVKEVALLFDDKKEYDRIRLFGLESIMKD